MKYWTAVLLSLLLVGCAADEPTLTPKPSASVVLETVGEIDLNNYQNTDFRTLANERDSYFVDTYFSNIHYAGIYSKTPIVDANATLLMMLDADNNPKEVKVNGDKELIDLIFQGNTPDAEGNVKIQGKLWSYTCSYEDGNLSMTTPTDLLMNDHSSYIKAEIVTMCSNANLVNRLNMEGENLNLSKRVAYVDDLTYSYVGSWTDDINDTLYYHTTAEGEIKDINYQSMRSWSSENGADEILYNLPDVVVIKYLESEDKSYFVDLSTPADPTLYYKGESEITYCNNAYDVTTGVYGAVVRSGVQLRVSEP